MEKEGNISLLENQSTVKGEGETHRVPSANSFKCPLLKLTQEETNLGARAETGAAEKEMSLQCTENMWPWVQSSALQEWVVL